MKNQYTIQSVDPVNGSVQVLFEYNGNSSTQNIYVDLTDQNAVTDTINQAYLDYTSNIDASNSLVGMTVTQQQVNNALGIKQTTPPIQEVS